MRIKKLVILGGVVGLVLGGGMWIARRAVEQVQIGTAYVAKLTCSCLFVSHRSAQSCETDYDSTAIKYLTREVEGRGVTVSAPGHLISTRAVFEQGFGCHLVN